VLDQADNILELRMHGGLGDELCATPIYKAVKKAEPTTYIKVVGRFARDILKYNPHVDEIADDSDPAEAGISLKWHNEAHRGYDMHLVDWYASQVPVELEDRTIDLFPGDEEREWAGWVEYLPRPIICYNRYAGWRSKEFNLTPVASALVKKSYTVIQVGSSPPFDGIGYNMVGHTPSVRHLGAMLSKCDLYLGNDSGCYHVAASMGIKTVVLFGSTDPQCYIHNPELDHSIYNEECYGCYNKKGDPSVIQGYCPRRDYVCMNITTDEVVAKVEEILDVR